MIKNLPVLRYLLSQYNKQICFGSILLSKTVYINANIHSIILILIDTKYVEDFNFNIRINNIVRMSHCKKVYHPTFTCTSKKGVT